MLARSCWVPLGPRPSQPARTCIVHEEARLSPLRSRLPPTARAWARAETARRRRFPFPRADAGVGRRGRGARACAEPRPGGPRGGAERGGAEWGGAGA